MSLFASLLMPWTAAVVLAAAVVVAMCIDHVFGELPARWHPVVWVGHYLGWAGRKVAPGVATVSNTALENKADYKAFWLGALSWSAGAALVLIVAVWLQEYALHLPGALAGLLLGFLLKPMLAWRMLRTEVQAVEQALAESLTAGRERLSWLVSRDVATLSESGVRESAIESLAENFNDSVVAPIFWFVLLGLPGAVLYRFANTADAMWGYPGVYKGRNWQWAGKWAARADDVLSWVPARITALLLLAVCWLHGLRQSLPTLRTLQMEAGRTPSPNSGWPMAAMALSLQVCLKKPQIYTLNEPGREPTAGDTQKAVIYASNMALALVFIAPVAIILVAYL